MADDSSEHETPTHGYDHDVVIVGGGPAGCAAGLFTARYGLDTVIFDRGTSSLRRCAFLENYLGFPAGIDIETFYGLMHDHVTEAGCELVTDMVTSVVRADETFCVQTQEGRVVRARRVVAATTYGGEYLRDLDSDDTMFVRHDHHDETHEEFNREYADADGRTPVEGLYVAGAMAGHGEQALIAAGHGSRVGREMLADVRREDGYWDEAAPHYDWMRRREALDHDWEDEDTWHRRFADHRFPDDHDLDDERLQRIREQEIAYVKSTHLDREERHQRTKRAQRRLAEHLDDALFLDMVDDDNLREYVSETKGWMSETDE